MNTVEIIFSGLTTLAAVIGAVLVLLQFIKNNKAKMDNLDADTKFKKMDERLKHLEYDIKLYEFTKDKK